MSPIDKPNSARCLTFNVSTMLAIFCPQQSDRHVMSTIFEAYCNHVCSVMNRVLQRPLVVSLRWWQRWRYHLHFMLRQQSRTVYSTFSNSAFNCSIGSEKMAQCSLGCPMKSNLQ